MIDFGIGKLYLNYVEVNQKFLCEMKGNSIIMNVKNNLSKYRNWKGITQQQLADILKISVNYIREIEQNNKYPKYQIRVRICKYFDVSQDQMFLN